MRFESHPCSLRQLQYAVAVEQTLSFGKAAELCHVSQPSLSAQIAELEAALSMKLFERGKRHVIVTPHGREVLERARLVLREVDGLVECALRSSNPLTGTLKIGIIPTISPYLLPSITPALLERFPSLTIRWIEDKTATLSAMLGSASLGSASLDAAIVALEAPLGDVDHEVIALDAFVLATPTGDAMSEGGRASFAELRGCGMLLLDDGHCFRDQALAVCSEASARELQFRATSLGTLTQMVAAGGAVTLLPELAVATEASRARIDVRRFEDPEPHRTIALVWRRQSPLATALRELAGAIRDAYPKSEQASLPHKTARKQGSMKPKRRA